MISLPVPVLYDLVLAVKERMMKAGVYNEKGTGEIFEIVGYGVSFVIILLNF